jgi:hypothetical protein
LLSGLLLRRKIWVIKIDMDRTKVKLSLKSSLSEGEKEEIWNKMYNPPHIHPDYIHIIHCPWCGVHMNLAIDFNKSCEPGLYSSKENWERWKIKEDSQLIS